MVPKALKTFISFWVCFKAQILAEYLPDIDKLFKDQLQCTNNISLPYTVSDPKIKTASAIDLTVKYLCSVDSPACKNIDFCYISTKKQIHMCKNVCECVGAQTCSALFHVYCLYFFFEYYPSCSVWMLTWYNVACADHLLVKNSATRVCAHVHTYKYHVVVLWPVLGRCIKW